MHCDNVKGESPSPSNTLKVSGSSPGDANLFFFFWAKESSFVILPGIILEIKTIFVNKIHLFKFT